MKLRVFPASVYFSLLVTVFPATLTTTPKENDEFSTFGSRTKHANVPFKDFYPRPSSLDQFRRQRLYPVREDDSITDITRVASLMDVSLGFNLPFFGFKFTYTWIHRDGYLLFSRGLKEYRLPIEFPVKRLAEKLENDPSLIAPWLSSQGIPREIPESGVYARLIVIEEESDDWLRQRLIMDFQEGMIGAGDFKPTYALIVTWRNMTFASRQTEKENLKTNTYQLVLATDELRTYCMFIYDNIEWISHADTYDGMKGPPAFVGFNAGNQTRAFELRPFSQRPRVQLLPHHGFANKIPGRWIFQINEEVWPGSCIDRELDPNWRDRGRLTFFPRNGNMLGGTMVNVTGPCLGNGGESSHIRCRFDVFDVEAVYRDVNHATCVQPFVSYHGYVNLSVSVNGGPFDFVGRYYVQPPEMSKEELVIRDNKDIEETPSTLTLLWRKEQLTWDGEAKVSLYLWGYRENAKSYPSLMFIDALSKGELRIRKEIYELDVSQFKDRRNWEKNNMTFGFISMNLTDTKSLGMGAKQSPVIWSRPMPLAWYFKPQWERKYGNKSSAHFCKNWSKVEQPWVLESLSEGISCPCTLSQALVDVGRFIPDSSCNMITRDCNIFHKGATHCVRSGRPSSNGHGLLCCYDDRGELIRAADTIYGSRPSKSHLFGHYPYKTKGTVPTLSHWEEDTMPFFFCCKWGEMQNSGLCQLYNDRRKSDDCISYETPGMASVFGDPHFLTFDGLKYIFNGKGEFVLVRDGASDVKIDIQGRFVEPLRDVRNLARINATKVAAIAARVGQSAVVEFRLRPRVASWQYKLFLIVDGEYCFLNGQTDRYQLFKGVTVYQPYGIHNMSHIIALFDSGVGLEVKSVFGNLAANVYLPRKYCNKTSGLLGRWSNTTHDEFILPQGKIPFNPPVTDEEIHAEFGMKWRLTEFDTPGVGRSLFRHDVIPFSEFDDPSFRPRFLRETLSIVPEAVIQTCGDSLSCSYDFILTEDKDFSVATKSYELSALSIKEEIEKKVIRCPSLPNPLNGRKSSYDTFPGAVVTISCNEDYRLMGDKERVCQQNGTWSGKPSRCMPKDIKDFYPRPSSMREFRSQLLYPVRDATYFFEVQVSDEYGLIDFNVPFFGSTFNQFYIHAMGIIGFSATMDSKYYASSPMEIIERLKEGDKCTIAPLFSNVGSFNSPIEAGLYIQKVDMKQENDTMLKERIQLDFEEGMVGAENFKPKFAIIITWRNATAADDDDEKTNTFQVVIATDEIDTYLMFNYDNIESISYLSPNLREVTTFVGFSGPRGTKVFEVEPYSRSRKIFHLQEHGYGNQLKGRWFFKVDEDIRIGSCLDTKMKPAERHPLTFHPSSGVMLGGKILNVSGPCFHPEDIIKCKFGVVESDAIYMDTNRAMCAQPQLFHYGYIELTVTINGASSGFSGKYYIAPPGISKAELSIDNRAEMDEYPTSMKIRWNHDSLHSNVHGDASLRLWGYREIADQKPTLVEIDTLDALPTSVRNVYELDPIELQKRNNYGEIDMEFGFLSMELDVPNTSLSRVLWSTPMPLAWYFRPQWEKKYGDGWKKHFCEEWSDREGEKFPPDGDLISCPCTLEQAEADRGRFFVDASCNYFEKNCQILHADAHHCLRYARPLADGSGQLCCYDHDGELMRSADSVYSGRPSRVNFYGKPPFNKEMTVPSLSHWYHDIIPFFFCCKWSGARSQTCDLFEEHRKSGDCVSYKPPGVGFVYGDPHFITFDGTEYTFNGKGEFVLVRGHASMLSLDIQGRFEEVLQQREGRKPFNATKLSAVVAKDGKSSVVEFRLHPHTRRARYKIIVVVDKEFFYFRDSSRIQSFKGVTIFQPIGIYNMSHVIAMFDGGAGVEVVTQNGNMAATVYLPVSYMHENATNGLLGRWSNEKADDFTLPNGTIAKFENMSTKSIHKSFGMEWRLTTLPDKNKGVSLFHHDSAEVYDDPNFQPVYELPRNGTYLPSDKLASKICSDSKTCFFDLVVTNNTDFAADTKSHLIRALLLKQEVQKSVIRCPALPPPKNGKKSDARYHVGSVARFLCNQDYELKGDSLQRCQRNGTWTGSTPSCVPKKIYQKQMPATPSF